MEIAPKISNWKELVEQFNLKTPIGKGYKTAIEISNDLTFANKSLDLADKRPQPQQTSREGVITNVGNDIEKTFTCITIRYEKDNFDSGICIFEFVRMEGNQRVFEYTGTAK